MGVRRTILKKEYVSFKREVKCDLKNLHPEVTLFGSYLKRKLGRLPNDVDVQIDVGCLSDKEFNAAKRKIAKIRKKYPDVDPELYSWKRMPTKSKRKKLRWDARWEIHAPIKK